MASSAFDPRGSVRFDLSRGAASDAHGARLLVVPAAAVAALAADHGDAARALAVELGRACGEKIASRLGGDGGVRDALLEVVVSHLAGELAVCGLGIVHLERWGRAMVCVVSEPSVDDDTFVGSVLAAAIGVAASRDVTAAPLDRDGTAMRFFIGSSSTAARVRELVEQRKPFAEIVAILQGGRS